MRLIFESETSFLPFNIYSPEFLGGHREEGTPDPIPNSEVKPLLAESTAEEVRGRIGRSAHGRRFFYDRRGPRPGAVSCPGLRPLSFAQGVPSLCSCWERLLGLRPNSIAAYFSYGILLRVLTVRALLAAIIGHLR